MQAESEHVNWNVNALPDPFNGIHSNNTNDPNDNPWLMTLPDWQWPSLQISDPTGSTAGAHDHSTEESDDPKDATYEPPLRNLPLALIPLQPTRKKAPVTSSQTKKPPVPRKGAPRLTEEQKANNKRRRQEDRTMLAEMRAFLAESSKKQKTVQEEMETTNSKMNTIQMQGNQNDYIIYLTTTVTAQQSIITNLNLEIVNMGAKYRSDLAEADLRHRDEMDEMRDALASHREHEAAIQLRINEWRSQRTRLLEENERLRTALATKPDTVPNNSNDSNTLPIKVKPESGKNASATDMSETSTDYTWLVVDEKNDERCLALYGFTSSQITEINAHVNALSLVTQRKGRGNKPSYSEKQVLLMLLYHFRHYTTLRVIHEKFGISITTITTTLNRVMCNIVPSLLTWSQQSLSLVPNQTWVQASYFLEVQTPQHTLMASNVYDQQSARHGVWIHCVHCNSSGKVVAYHTSNTNEPDAQWFVPYQPFVDANAVCVAVSEYGYRMRGKFSLAASRYRGTLQDIDNTVRGLLALTNLDLAYGNALCKRVSVDLYDQ